VLEGVRRSPPPVDARVQIEGDHTHPSDFTP
jgi:hypothetical protein